MSELINVRDSITVRRQFLATASALALTAYIASTAAAKAEDADRPTVWLELGGQMELMQGTGTTFTAPFMSVSPTPELYQDVPPIESQHPSRHAFGLEGKLSVQPEGSDWIFAAGIRYGRAHGSHHHHAQLPGTPPIVLPYYGTVAKYVEPYADAKTSSSESHAVLDFSVGKDVGLGFLGQHGSSDIDFGVRFAQFSTRSDTEFRGRPTVDFTTKYISYFQLTIPAAANWNQYHLVGHAERNFRGIGPSLSWNASSTLAGNVDDGELNLDWGVNAALLFGRQKSKASHSTTARTGSGNDIGDNIYTPRSNHSTRSRSVTVPNVGGFVGLSARKYNAKISLGYRADFFFGAVDGGIDARESKDLGFHGPFATVSIGFP